MSILKRLFGIDSNEDNLRIIIARHGERADLALGPKWTIQMQRRGGYDSRVSYLTPRDDFDEWNYDPPLTVIGERQSMSIGRKLLELGYPIDYCYSSPAYRSIQTANKILESQGRKAVPINIEPGMIKIIFILHKNRKNSSFFLRLIRMSFMVCRCTTTIYTT
jgi:broad specificity phosphatase PhoE